MPDGDESEGQRHELHHRQGRHRDLLQGLGCRPRCHFLPRLAAECGRVGRPDALLMQNGFRVVAHDRRGHGRSSQASGGNDMNGYADDLAAVIEALGLTDVTLISTGGGEVARYIGRHGTRRVAKAVLISAVPPIMVQTPDNPEGLPIAVFDEMRANLMKDRSQFYQDLAQMFYGANRQGAKVSKGILDQSSRTMSKNMSIGPS
ncbi:alpha/beta fold hydrolase [Micromonospora sp. NPDC047730]|uniref:alpha/beta fold hydrolase n=1 Tax=Micromonospora sp. NPDC047730 TaxID=3364253 RepID=UPI0037144215